MKKTQGFLLGLANGANCIAYCIPSLVPYLLGEGRNIRKNACILGQFLTGRLLGYLIFAILAWIVGRCSNYLLGSHVIFLGLSYIILAALLLFYGIANPSMFCAVQTAKITLTSKAIQKYTNFLPLITGFVTGLNLCPPFLLVFARAVELKTISHSIWQFFTFFLGTSLYFLPIPLLGAVNHFPALKTVGKMAAVLMSAYYFYTGAITLSGGMQNI